jgi:mannose-6-phosphate isomerase-like protein (cupin superfamily)
MPKVDLTTLPLTPTAYGRWQPLNGPLDLSGFGISAIECEPGEDIGIEHDETDTGQQEAYIVVSGRAEFTVGDDVFVAGPGQVVSAPDPAVRRGYQALEHGTRIVCVGAVPVTGADFGAWIADSATA